MYTGCDYDALVAEGFVFLPKFCQASSTLAIAESIGRILNLPAISTVQTLHPLEKKDAAPQLYSGSYGLESFPLHTDLAHWYLPPRYLLLRCIRPSTHVFTPIVNYKVALAGICPASIHRALYRPRRKFHRRLTLLRLVQPSATLLFRWDQLFLAPMNEAAIEIANHLRAIRSDDCNTRIVFENVADTLLLDNWKVMHGRSAVSKIAKGRILERVYLSEVRM